MEHAVNVKKTGIPDMEVTEEAKEVGGREDVIDARLELRIVRSSGGSTNGLVPQVGVRSNVHQDTLMNRMLHWHDLTNFRIEVTTQQHRELGPPTDLIEHRFEEAIGGTNLGDVTRAGIRIDGNNHD
eukprot:15473546-Alexandrium_andersonii.AAC.1